MDVLGEVLLILYSRSAPIADMTRGVEIPTVSADVICVWFLSFGLISASSDAVVISVDGHNKGILEVEIVSTFIPVLKGDHGGLRPKLG